MSSVEERVKNIIVTQLGVKAEDVKNESKFIDDLGADSLDTVELVMARLKRSLKQKFLMKKLKK